MEENKYEDSDSDDDYKEVVVNDSDFRREIYEFPEHRDLMIIKSIGQIESQYDYKIEKDFKISAVGTGTVYHVANNVAFVVTCAHNIRHRIFECPKCDIYNKIKKCSKCAETLYSSHKKILTATHIEFKRRNITKNDFGLVEQVYKCDEIYVPGGYEQNTRLQKGFDFAVLMFRDNNGYYLKHCGNITLAIGKDILNTYKYKRFCMFGYPGIDYANAKKDTLYGYAMKSDAKDKGFELKECEESKDNFKNETQYVLRQRQLDASAGQSGSVVFAVTGKMQVIVFAVHVGGHEKNKEEVEDYSYNVATLLSEEYIKILRNVTDLYVQHLEIRQSRKELNLMKESNAKLQNNLTLLNKEKKNDEKENKQNMTLLNEFKNENKILKDKIMGLEIKLNQEKQKNDPILSYGILKTIILILFCAIIYKIAFPGTHTNITLLNETNAQLKATQAYNYIMGIGNDEKEKQLTDAKSELNQMGIGGFNIDANGIALLDIALEKYKDVTEQLAYTWEWSDRIRSLLDAVPHSGKVFSGSHNIRLDASTWKLKGTYSRFAAFRSNENTFSIYVANAKFEFKIPKEQREGNFLDELGVSSSGTIKGEYMDKIITLLEHKALERFQIDVVKPEQDDYLTAQVHSEL